MKKLLVLIVASVFSIAVFADYNSDVNVIKTNEESIFVKKMKVGVKTITVTTFTGEKVKYDKKDIKSYIKNGVQYDRVKKVKNNECTGQCCFMQLIRYKNGFKVYKHEFCNDNGELTSRHLVFKDNEFVVEFTHQNLANLKAFFEM